jgi:transcriptional regulator with GAF, ATPase, and Fis domain
MRELRRSLWNNVFTHDMRLYERYLWDRMEDFSTLLLGETGTGKGAAAAAIGRSGFIPFDDTNMRFRESFTRSFVSINLSQFPESLIESELFGHRKGAFTGAVEAHEGVFAGCSPHGAIFIDEIGDVSVPVQIKLLQVLQDRVFSPVGSHERKRFHGRVIAATNRPLDVLRREKLFRDDFFYRLSSDVITVPPLRRRVAEDPAELRDLVGLVVQRTTGRDSEELHALVLNVIEDRLGPDYPWPGNVRELEQAVRRILLTRTYGGDTGGIADDLKGRLHRRLDLGEYAAAELLSDYCRLLYARYGTYEEVARRTELDRRTVKKYITSSE